MMNFEFLNGNICIPEMSMRYSEDANTRSSIIRIYVELVELHTDTNYGRLFIRPI